MIFYFYFKPFSLGMGLVFFFFNVSFNLDYEGYDDSFVAPVLPASLDAEMVIDLLYLIPR